MLAMASMFASATVKSHGFSRTRAAMCGTYSSVAIVSVTAQMTKKMMQRIAQTRSLSCSSPSVFITP